MSDKTDLTCDIQNGIALITMNRPEAMNALSISMRLNMEACLDRLDADESVHVVVLTGAGERAFSAGVDLKEMGENADMTVEGNLKAGDLVPAMNKFSKPIIGAINGVAITGGLEIALACDILIAADHARFADTHARVGLVPTWGLSQKLPRIVGESRAKELSFTGNFFSAQEAQDWGLVNHVVPGDKLLDKAMSLAADIVTCVPETIAGYKHLMDYGLGQNLAEASQYEYDYSMAKNANVTAADIEARREEVMKRGKAQK